MKLNDLLKGINYSGTADDIDITDITSDSRNVSAGSLFVCIPGNNSDGHDYAAKAAEMGCSALIAEHETMADVPQIIVKNSRIAYTVICANFFGNPQKSLKLVGVTGTNGKTTTALIIKQIFEYTGHKSGLIGTIQNMAGDEVLPAHYTTPEPYELFGLFKIMHSAGCEYVVMEVSSQALAQERVAGCKFEASVFTNITQDHLDYHKTMENYISAKQKLFEQSKYGIFNLDDAYANKLISEAGCKTVTYSTMNMDADYTARNIKYNAESVNYDIVGLGMIGRVKLFMPGSFNVYNSIAAVSCVVTLGLPLTSVLDAVKATKGVKGRAEVVPTGRDFTIIIDYAHTPDALEKITKSINEYKKSRLVVLFGCGGDRDKTKRPLMGKIAAENADYLIVTSDNPRTEEPSAIIDDIIQGIKNTKTKYIKIENRRQAIEYAIKNAQEDDIILLAGKGHEDYQILGHNKIHFDEREVVAEILDSIK